MKNAEPSRQHSLKVGQVLELGEMAKKSHPILQIILQKKRLEYESQVRATKPEESKKRDSLWLKDRMLGEFGADLDGLIMHAERVYAEQAEQNSPEFKKQQKLDEQGFGLSFDEEGRQKA